MPVLVYRPDVIPLLIGVGISAYLLFIGFKYRHTKIGIDFMVLMSLVFVWQISDAFNISTAVLWLVNILAGISVACMAAIPVIILVFAARLTRRDRLVKPRFIALLCIVPLITAILISTNHLHHLVFTGFSLRVLTTGFLISTDYGPWYSFHGGYSYLLISTAIILALDWLRKANPAIRGQVIILLLGMLPPIAANLLYTSQIINMVIDPTPLTFCISGFILLWGLYRYGLLDMVPIAREIVIESIHDGVIVVDSNGSVMDINPAAAKLFEDKPRDLLGRKIKQLFDQQGTRLSIEKNGKGEYTSLRLNNGNGIVDYEVRTSPITDASGILEGKVILFNDVTKQRRLEEELRQLSSMDHLTGLYNRRCFFDELEKQIRLAQRYHFMLSVCMLDLDRFKELNDRFGHQVGDEALALAAKTIQRNVRKTDFVARYGGDELTLLLVHTGERGAMALCQRITRAVGDIMIQNGFQLGVSIGITCMTKTDGENGESMIGRADQALYRAKAEGRGGIAVG
jgi:diguanylate cyclase (GGDEF)-like protein/PAS domain S-box-containing protein